MSKLTKKDRIAHLEFQVAWLTDAVHELQGTENLESKPQLKQLDQSIFNGLDEKWRFAAVDKCGEVWHSTHKTQPSVSGTHLSPEPNADSMQAKGYYDASNWQNSLIERDTAKELSGSDLTRKMLADSTDMVNCYVSDDSDYDALNDKDERTIVGFSDGWFHTNSVASWKYAVPAPKEKELTGSELCRAMLERGDKYVMCKTSGTGEAEAMEAKYPDVIQKYDWEFFYTPYKKRYAVPINNQGEPLTASEVGL